MPFYVELLVVMGVGECLCPIYSSVVRMNSTSRALENKPPNSASATEDMMSFIIPALTSIALLCMLGFEEFYLFPR